ncbi:MAG: GAF domain-containing sensor histidine kinase [Thermoanaerobaculia bacterium]
MNAVGTVAAAMAAAGFDARLDARTDPKYPLFGAGIEMTLKRLREITIVAPIVIVIVLEAIRFATIGSTSAVSRLLLDGVVAIAFMVFGFVMAGAIARAHRRLEHQNAELLALHGAGLDITAELSLDAVLNKVVDRARTLVGAQYGALSVVESGGRIEAFLTSGITPEQRAILGPPPTGHGLLGVVLHHGEHLRLDNLTKDPRSEGFPPHHPPMRSLLAVPIACKSPFVGNLYLAEKEGGALFTRGDEDTLQRFAVQAAIAIDNAYLHRQVATLAVTQERMRIAHEMHDGIAQVLGYVNTKVQAANEYIRRGNTDEASVQLRELATAARDAYGDVREAIVDLRTLPEVTRTFGEVLEEYLSRWKEQTGVSTQVTMASDLVLPVSTELQLMRIIQESLTNIRKHAKATTAKVSLRRADGLLTLLIEDDGVGFNPAAKTRSDFPRFGLATMRERAEGIGGTFTIESLPGQGTRVHAEVPVSET